MRSLRSLVPSITRGFSSSVVRLNAIPSLHTLTDSEKSLKEAISRFAQTEIAPRVKQMDESQTMDKSIIKGLFEQGYMGIEIPEKYGGSELSFTSSIIAIEELAKIDPSVSVCCDVQNTLVNTLFRKYANEDVNSRFLPRLATNAVGCFCLSEAGSGSDAFALKTRAKEDGGDYIINGSKMWITNSGEAEIFLVFANVAPEKGYKGITCFVIDRSMGVQVGKKENKLGIALHPLAL